MNTDEQLDWLTLPRGALSNRQSNAKVYEIDFLLHYIVLLIDHPHRMEDSRLKFMHLSLMQYYCKLILLL